MNDCTPHALAPRVRRIVLVCQLLWTVLLIITSIVAVVQFPAREYAVFPLVILGILSAPLVIVAWFAAPWGYLNATVQYQRIKHLRVVTATQAAIGGVALALVFNFDSDDESMSLLVSLLVWTATALVHFVPFWAQITMETPEHKKPYDTWRGFLGWLNEEFRRSGR